MVKDIIVPLSMMHIFGTVLKSETRKFHELNKHQNIRSLQESAINHRSTEIPNPKCGNGSNGKTRNPYPG
eukprot:15358430-Ditylum_brightwellii.AAC.1